MECIPTTSFSMLINGKFSKTFHPEKDIWQGDPISLYIFIICVKNLGRYIHVKSKGILEVVLD